MSLKFGFGISSWLNLGSLFLARVSPCHYQETQCQNVSLLVILPLIIWLKCCQPGFSSFTFVINKYFAGRYFKTVQISCISSFHPLFWHPNTMMCAKWKFSSYIILPTFINWNFTVRKSCPFSFYKQRYIFVNVQSHKWSKECKLK